jgi:uncharacterized protein YbaA (DUF1428 family)
MHANERMNLIEGVLGKEDADKAHERAEKYFDWRVRHSEKQRNSIAEVMADPKIEIEEAK